MADKRSVLLIAGIFVSQSAFAELPDVETIPLNQPSIGERLSAESSGNQNSLQRKIDALQSEVQELRGMVEEQSHLIQQLSEKQKTLYLDLDKRISKDASPKVNIEPTEIIKDNASKNDALELNSEATPQSVPSGIIQNESTSYQFAFDLIQAKQYTQAIKALEDYLTQYPNGQYTPNVYYWLGEVNSAIKNFEQAAINFNKVVDYYPLHAKAPDALLKLGYIAYEQGNTKEAGQLLQDVKNRFPETSAARLAGAKLQAMRQAGQI